MLAAPDQFVVWYMRTAFSEIERSGLSKGKTYIKTTVETHKR